MSFHCFFTIKLSVWSQESSSSSLVVLTRSPEVHILFQWSEWPLGPEEQLHPLHLHLAAVARQQAALPDCARVLQVGTNHIFHYAKNQKFWTMHYCTMHCHFNYPSNTLNNSLSGAATYLQKSAISFMRTTPRPCNRVSCPILPICVHSNSVVSKFNIESVSPSPSMYPPVK